MPFRHIVFAGGGNRCFWQAGFWTSLTEATVIKPDSIAAVSAGSAMACMLMSNTTQQVIHHFSEITKNNRKNFYLKHLFKKAPVFPQAALFRETILTVMDQVALQRLHAGPDILVQLTRLPRWLSPRIGMMLGIALYQTEKKFKQPIHPTYSKRVGFRPEIISVKTCHTASALADLILASSCTPPFTPLMYRDNKAVLDGGIVDNVPVHAIENPQGKTLVLLTRQYGSLLPSNTLFHYVQPSKPIPVSSWDYTNPCGIHAAFSLGRRDGEVFAQEYLRIHQEKQNVSTPVYEICDE